MKNIFNFFCETSSKMNGTAVMFENESITYNQLYNKACQYANCLRDNNVSKGDFVGVYIEPCIELIIAIFAIFKIGAIYVPVDSEYPEQRVNYIIENSDMKVILVRNNKTISHTKFKVNIIDINNICLNEINKMNCLEEVEKDDLAYVIYTSGSTGKPKGVMIKHGSVINLTESLSKEIFTNEEEYKIISLASISFDMSIVEIVVAILCGLTVVIANKDQRNNYEETIKVIKEKKINILQLTPSRLRLLTKNGKDTNSIKDIKKLMVGGEDFFEDLFENIKKSNFKGELYNLYGPTEATVWVTLKKLLNQSKINIGKPLKNTKILILDKNQKLVPIGVVGEIYICGENISSGYIKEFELTKEKFVDNPYIQDAKMYKTGDLAKWLPDGDLEYKGRTDNQVKIRGYRVELGEVENVLRKNNKIKNAVVIAKEDKISNKYLCAYIVSDRGITIKKIREYLIKVLPNYMIPSYFIMIDKIPITVNGKLDRKALPEPDGSIETGVEYVAPRNKIEEKLVEIWQEVLGVEKVGVHDNFFEIGGHSFKIISIASEILKKFNKTISLNEIYNKPTISNIAKFIIEKDEELLLCNTNLVLLKQNKNANKNVFFIHAGFGDVDNYIQLSNLIKECNCWGIKYNKSKDYIPEDCSIKGLALKYIKLIKLIQPHGPYNIIGWCAGGTIAFEIVNQLEEEGEKLNFFSMINSQPPLKIFKDYIEEFTLDNELKIVKKYAVDEKIIKFLENKQTISQIWEGLISELNKRKIDSKLLFNNISHLLHPNYNNLDLNEIINYANIWRSLVNARSKYIPDRKIETQVYFIESNEDKIHKKALWNEYCSLPIIVKFTHGDHFSMFKKPYVNKLAEILNNYLGI